jgi:hypothetical protein
MAVAKMQKNTEAKALVDLAESIADLMTSSRPAVNAQAN